MEDDFRGGLIGGVIMVVLGIAGLALGIGILGGVALVVGLVGVGIYLALRHGWITPRTGRRTGPIPRTSGPRPSEPRPSEPRPSALLSEDGRERVAEIVAELHEAGVFAPEAPDPVHLHESVADHGEPVTVDAVLDALHEASFYHPDFRLESCTANLVHHSTQVEQFPDHLRGQIDDLVRLAGGALAVVVIDIQQDVVEGSRQVPTRIRWRVDGVERDLSYLGASKDLSTVIHVALARAMVATGAPLRLASLWTDQGMWITALPGRESVSGWERLAEQEPLAAGEI